jgi:hypothetical protein
MKFNVNHLTKKSLKTRTINPYTTSMKSKIYLPINMLRPFDGVLSTTFKSHLHVTCPTSPLAYNIGVRVPFVGRKSAYMKMRWNTTKLLAIKETPWGAKAEEFG